MLEEERGTVGGLRKPAPPAVPFLIPPGKDDDENDEKPVPFLRSLTLLLPCGGGRVCMSGGVDSVVREMTSLPLRQRPVSASFSSAWPRLPLGEASAVILSPPPCPVAAQCGSVRGREGQGEVHTAKKESASRFAI